ncbi:MAG: plastocyanin/azurin family copper-binding protein [Planctomycetota bacterium]
MRSLRTLLALGALLLASTTSNAQTTHDIDNGPFFDFVPANLTIDVGDTVRWVWVGGLHNVESGVGGIPDGIFSSGGPTPVVGTEFSVTFDQAFLDANPVLGNVYDYYCVIHVSLGQVGTITVNEPAVVAPYGCINPTGSLLSLGGEALAGGSWTVGVENPLGTQPAGSLAFLSVAAAPSFGFPCGLALPGFGMSAPGAVGELLIDLAAPNPLETLGPVAWAGTGTPAPFPVALPDNPVLVGFTLYFQGLMVDAGGTSGITLGATEGLQVTVGL